VHAGVNSELERRLADRDQQIADLQRRIMSQDAETQRLLAGKDAEIESLKREVERGVVRWQDVSDAVRENPKLRLAEQAFKLQRAHARLLVELLHRTEVISRDQTKIILCGDEERTGNVVDQAYSKVRKALKRHGIEVTLLYRDGWRLTWEAKTKVRRILRIKNAANRSREGHGALRQTLFDLMNSCRESATTDHNQCSNRGTSDGTNGDDFTDDITERQAENLGGTRRSSSAGDHCCGRENDAARDSQTPTGASDRGRD
jgi:DNA-binding winged helix-turn-helix (wHTH) protein